VVLGQLSGGTSGPRTMCPGGQFRGDILSCDNVTTVIDDMRNGNQREDQRAQNSTTEVSFCTVIIRLSRCMTPFLRAVRFLYITLHHDMEQLFPYQECNDIKLVNTHKCVPWLQTG